jgi:PEGA domain-containing protein
VAVFNKDGDSIVSHSTRSLGNAISADWPARAEKTAAASQTVQPVAAIAKSMEVSSASKISVSSIPANADIEIDGNFVGNTPSLIE